MSCTAICCLNLPPKTTPFSSTRSPPSEPTSLPWRRNEGSWKRHCIAGVAYMIIGVAGIGNNCYAIAAEENTGASATTEVEVVNQERWSDKRKCPPWRMNSFELVVPENLPRPYTPRAWESVRNYYSKIKTAPSVRIAAKANPRCFSM